MSNPEGGRIAFGLSGGALVEAPAVLSTCVRPWAYLWNDFDCVALDRRKQAGESKMQPKQAGGNVASFYIRNVPTPLPLRSRPTGYTPPAPATDGNAPSLPIPPPQRLPAPSELKPYAPRPLRRYCSLSLTLSHSLSLTLTLSLSLTHSSLSPPPTLYARPPLPCLPLPPNPSPTQPISLLIPLPPNPSPSLSRTRGPLTKRPTDPLLALHSPHDLPFLPTDLPTDLPTCLRTYVLNYLRSPHDYLPAWFPAPPSFRASPLSFRAAAAQGSSSSSSSRAQQQQLPPQQPPQPPRSPPRSDGLADGRMGRMGRLQQEELPPEPAREEAVPTGPNWSRPTQSSSRLQSANSGRAAKAGALVSPPRQSPHGSSRSGYGSPGRGSPPRSRGSHSPRTSREKSLTHMWDVVRHVTHLYTDLPPQLKLKPPQLKLRT